MTTIHRRLAPLIMFAVTASAFVACGGPTPRSLCEDACDCIGCSDAELEDCVEDLEDVQDYAEEEGCSDEFDAYLDCLSGFECRGDDVELPDECAELEDDLDEACGASDTIIGGDLCQAAVSKIDGCLGQTTSPDPQTGCSSDVFCVANCVLDADCGAFDGSDDAAAQAFADCATDCNL